jgi:hypothetical protein
VESRVAIWLRASRHALATDEAMATPASGGSPVAFDVQPLQVAPALLSSAQAPSCFQPVSAVKTTRTAQRVPLRAAYADATRTGPTPKTRPHPARRETASRSLATRIPPREKPPQSQRKLLVPSTALRASLPQAGPSAPTDSRESCAPRQQNRQKSQSIEHARPHLAAPQLINRLQRASHSASAVRLITRQSVYRCRSVVEGAGSVCRIPKNVKDFNSALVLSAGVMLVIAEAHAIGHTVSKNKGREKPNAVRGVPGPSAGGPPVPVGWPSALENASLIEVLAHGGIVLRGTRHTAVSAAVPARQ